MADGTLCLFQRDTRAIHVSGVDALRRAEEWLRDQARGELTTSLDTEAPELEEHYQRQGQVVAGPCILDGTYRQRAKLLGVRTTPTQDMPYVVLTHAETADGWVDDREVLAQFLGFWAPDIKPYWAEPPATLWDRANANPQTFWVGECIPLDQEPPIVRDIESVARLVFPSSADPVAELASAYAVQLLRDATLLLAFRYPARKGGRFDWLFLSLRLRSLEPDRVQFSVPIIDVANSREQLLQRAEIEVLRLQDFRQRSLQLRNAGCVPSNASDLNLAVLGCGAVGSVVADLLVKAGVGRLTVCDYQQLAAGNVLRHTGGLVHVGDLKTTVVRLSAWLHNPYCEVEATQELAQSLPLETLRKVGATVSTIADDAIELIVNDRATAAVATVYYLRGQRRGSVGRLIRVRPGVDACFECVHRHYADDFAYLEVPPDREEIVGHECGSPVLAASGADLAAVAAIGVRRILDDIASPGESNHWVWTTIGVPGHAHLSSPMGSLSARLAPRADCDTCAPSPVSEIVLDGAVSEAMTELARAAYPSETGGILVGSIAGGRVHVIAATDAGPGAIQSPTLFLRDGPYCQRRLEELIRVDPGVTYVGEWHSHPNHSPEPSGTDVASLASISADPHFRAEVPVMIIVSLEAPDAPPTLSGSAFPAWRRGYLVPVKTQPKGADRGGRR